MIEGCSCEQYLGLEVSMTTPTRMDAIYGLPKVFDVVSENDKVLK